MEHPEDKRAALNDQGLTHHEQESQPLTEDRDAAARRRKYERDNEFLIAFQTRQQRTADSSIGVDQKTGLDSKSEPTLFPQSHTPSPEGAGSCVNLTGDGGSRVQVMKEHWEKGEPLQIPPYNEPKSASSNGCIVSDGVWGAARETPVTGERSDGDGGGGGGGGETGGRGGGGDDRERRASGGGGGGGGDSQGEGGGGGGGKGGREGGGEGKGGGGGGDGGGDNWRRQDKDDDEETEESDEETDNEEEGEELHGISSTTPLLQTLPPSDNKPSTVTTDHTPQQTRRDHIPPTAADDQPKVETVVTGSPLKVARASSQSDLWSTDSSSVDMTLPPPPLHSTLLMTPLTPSQFRYLPITRSEEGREETRSKSHDIKPESHDQASESHDMSGNRDETSHR